MTYASPELTLFQPRELRRRADRLLSLGTENGLTHVAADLSRLGGALRLVLETTRQNYPDLQVPPYGIWRDFEACGIDRWGALASARNFENAGAMLTSAADLAILGTYMKTRRPDGWTFEDRVTGTRARGKTASALAALSMFTAGSFSSDISDPLRVDAQALVRLEIDELADGLQWDRQSDEGSLTQMQLHLKRLGEALALRPDFFGEGSDTRPGHLATYLAESAGTAVGTAEVLDMLLQALVPVWQGGAHSGELSLGDSFSHSALKDNDSGFVVPFHLAAQEMAYSLTEPFAWAGLEMAGLNSLTAPSDEYHVALFLHTGVLNLQNVGADLSQEAARDRMIELRALGSALADRLAAMLRQELDVSPEQLPLTCILEGGTSRAGALSLNKIADETPYVWHFLNPEAVFWLPFG